MTSDRYRVRLDARLSLGSFKTDDDGGLDKRDAEAEFARLHERLIELQELLYAEGKHALLVVLQAMDTGGKDSTIRAVFGGVNPLGCQVTSFKAPSDSELAHDFLWRVHRSVPPRGFIGVFNRSHYEDVLVVRVKKLVSKDRWERRYDHINAFERLLHDEGTHLVKFYLHISKDYQKKRLQRRLDHPDKHWKFNPADLGERERWDDYMKAYEKALSKCSTPEAPWYIVPAECRWFRNLIITRVLVEKLESLGMHYPKPVFDPSKIIIT